MGFKFNPLTSELDLVSDSIIFDVRTYRAIGDGTTDDKTAIDNAINAANAAGGGTVAFGTGLTYLTSGGHIVYSKLRYDLGGSTVKLKAASNVDVFIGENFSTLTGTNVANGTSNPRDFAIFNGFIDGNASNQTSGTGKGLKVYAHNYIIRDLFITNCKGDGFYSEWSSLGSITAPTNQMEAKITNLKTSSNGGKGINFLGPHDSVFMGSESYNNTSDDIYVGGNSAGTWFNNCHAYLNTSIGVNIVANSIHWNDSIAEVTSPGVAIVVGADEVEIKGGVVIDPQAGASTGIQIGNASHAAKDCIIDTMVQTTDSGSVYFYSSGGYNDVNVKVFQNGGTVITGTPVKTDNVAIDSASQIYGLATGNVPQTNGNLNRMMLPDPVGTATWYKLGTWYASGGVGGDRIRININGTGGYNADAASAGRTVIVASTGNGVPTPNAQGIWFTENGNALLDTVKLKKGADVNTWDVYVHLLAAYTGNCFISVDLGNYKYPSSFIYNLSSTTDPGAASSTIAVLTEQISFTSPVFTNYLNTQQLYVTAGSVAAATFAGVGDGNQFSNFVLSDGNAVGGATNHYWSFSHRANHEFWMFNWNGSVFTNAAKLTEAGNLTITGLLNTASFTPASASATGVAGTIAWDSSYIYVCTAANTWKRVAIASW